MRNNQDRLGVGVPTDNLQSAESAPPQVSEQVQFIVPTEVVDLPSGGLLYDEGHPLHNRTSVEIKHMTTKEEDILTNKSFIKNGTVIDRLLKSVLVDPKMNVSDMLVGDKNALVVACRKHGYGAEYTTRVTCTSCGANQKHTFDLDEIENIDYQSNLDEFNATIDYENKTVILPIQRTNTKLELKILKDSKPQLNKKQKNDKLVSSQYKKLIQSVNGNSDPRYIQSYIDSMSALDSRYLRAAYAKIVPGVDFSCEFECQECGAETNMEVPLTAEFFWPDA